MQVACRCRVCAFRRACVCYVCAPSAPWRTAATRRRASRRTAPATRHAPRRRRCWAAAARQRARWSGRRERRAMTSAVRRTAASPGGGAARVRQQQQQQQRAPHCAVTCAPQRAARHVSLRPALCAHLGRHGSAPKREACGRRGARAGGSYGRRRRRRAGAQARRRRAGGAAQRARWHASRRSRACRHRQSRAASVRLPWFRPRPGAALAAQRRADARALRAPPCASCQSSKAESGKAVRRPAALVPSRERAFNTDSAASSAGDAGRALAPRPPGLPVMFCAARERSAHASSVLQRLGQRMDAPPVRGRRAAPWRACGAACSCARVMCRAGGFSARCGPLCGPPRRRRRRALNCAQKNTLPGRGLNV
jgi:hypothetical protein